MGNNTFLFIIFMSAFIVSCEFVAQKEDQSLTTRPALESSGDGSGWEPLEESILNGAGSVMNCDRQMDPGLAGIDSAGSNFESSSAGSDRDADSVLSFGVGVEVGEIGPPELAFRGCEAGYENIADLVLTEYDENKSHYLSAFINDPFARVVIHKTADLIYLLQRLNRVSLDRLSDAVYDLNKQTETLVLVGQPENNTLNLELIPPELQPLLDRLVSLNFLSIINEKTAILNLSTDEVSVREGDNMSVVSDPGSLDVR